MNSFYITVLSDSSLNIFKNNTQSQFRTKLAKPIHIEKGQWEMALVELIIPSQIVNVSEEESKFKIVTTDLNLGKKMNKFSHQCRKINDQYSYACCIPPGVYSSPEHLITEIDEAIQKAVGKLLHDNEMTFHIGYSTPKKRVKFNSTHTEMGLHFHPKLLMKLGGVSMMMGDIYPTDKNPFPYGVDLNVGTNHLFIYSDLADFTFLGNIEAPILRVVPFESTRKDSNHTHEEFLNLHYIPISKSNFDEIEINIRGDTGEVVHFVEGKSMVKLHFRKKTH